MRSTELQPTSQRPTDRLRGEETILLCEDEAKLMDFVRRALQARGYTVLATEQAGGSVGNCPGRIRKIFICCLRTS